MCRWLAYSGEALTPAVLILDAQHSLVAQSLNSPLGAETVNGDGFGFGWYPEGSKKGSAPALFHSIEPAWHDENLRELTNSVASPLFFGHVRAAGGPPIQQTNCHPFRHENWMFMHNGFLDGFSAMKRDLVFSVDESLFPLISHWACRTIRSPRWARRYGASRRSASRRGSGSRCRARSRCRTAELREMYPDAARLDVFGDKAKVVVSEPLNDLPGAFVEVEESTVAILNDDGYHHEAFLASDD